jgi:hypothetical protein
MALAESGAISSGYSHHRFQESRSSLSVRVEAYVLCRSAELAWQNLRTCKMPISKESVDHLFVYIMYLRTGLRNGSFTMEPSERSQLRTFRLIFEASPSVMHYIRCRIFSRLPGSHPTVAHKLPHRNSNIQDNSIWSLTQCRFTASSV